MRVQHVLYGLYPVAPAVCFYRGFQSLQFGAGEKHLVGYVRQRAGRCCSEHLPHGVIVRGVVLLAAVEHGAAVCGQKRVGADEDVVGVYHKEMLCPADGAAPFEQLLEYPAAPVHSVCGIPYVFGAESQNSVFGNECQLPFPAEILYGGVCGSHDEYVPYGIGHATAQAFQTVGQNLQVLVEYGNDNIDCLVFRSDVEVADEQRVEEIIMFSFLGGVHNLVQCLGVISGAGMKRAHKAGAMTILSGFSFSHPPHQLKELLAKILCLHLLMRNMSCQLSAPLFQSTQTVFSGRDRWLRTHSKSSENT